MQFVVCVYISHSSCHLFNIMIDSRSKLTVGIWHSSCSRWIAFFAAHSFPDNPRWPRTQQKTILKKWLFKWSALVNMQSTKRRSVFKTSIAGRHDLESVKIIKLFWYEFPVYSKAKCKAENWALFWNVDSIMLLSSHHCCRKKHIPFTDSLSKYIVVYIHLCQLILLLTNQIHVNNRFLSKTYIYIIMSYNVIKYSVQTTVIKLVFQKPKL